MARRKFKRAATHRRRSGGTKVRTRRRRMGATSALNLSASSPLVQWGSALFGFIKPDLLPISKIVGDKVDPKIVAAGEVGLGFLLARRKNKGKGMVAVITTAGSWYLIGAGVKNGLKAFGIMSGVSPYGRVNVINGQSPYGRVNVVNGMSPNRTLAGGFSPSRTINKVMTGVGDNSNGSGSGIRSNVPGSSYMN